MEFMNGLPLNYLSERGYNTMQYKMKNSGVEWIGKIPDSWDIVRFKFMHKGSNVGLSIDKEFWSTNENDTVFYTAGQKSIYTNYLDFDEEMLTKENDLLLARNGTPYVYFPKVGAIYTDHIIRVSIDTNYDKAYIRYCLQQSIAKEVVDTVSIATWSVPIWNRQCLPHPSLQEQQSIASYLDEKCSAIDEIIAEAKATIDEYKSWKASVIFEAVTKGLNPNVEMKDSGVEWIGRIPKGWNIIKFKYLLSIKSGDAIRNEMLKDDGLYPVYGGGELIGYNDNYNVPNNTILVGRVGARCGCVTKILEKAWATDNALVLSDIQNLNYVYYLLIAADLNKLNSSNAQPLITATKIKNHFTAFVKDKNEQDKIVAYLDEKCAAIDGVIAEKEALIGELESYKKSLIFETVTGKRRVAI